MNAAVKAPKGIVTSTRLIDYQLTAAHRGLLKRFDDLTRYMRLANKKPPCLRLRGRDYAEIDAKIREQSNGARRLSDLTHCDVPILSASEVE